MKKYSIYILLVGIMAMLYSCRDTISVDSQTENVPEGYVPIRFNVDIPEMTEVSSRAVDPDGIDIQQLTLFCFNAYGIFISTVEADIEPSYEQGGTQSTSGTFTASVPSDTKIIHFTANLPGVFYENKDFRGKSEDEVKANMEGSTGKIVYWTRVQCAENEEISDELAQYNSATNPLKLIRNHAKVWIGDWGSEAGSEFVVTGFVTTNVHAFGTVAPYHNTYGFPTPGTAFTWPGTEDYVTLAANKAMMSDITEVDTKAEDYIYEHENTYDNPVSVIIRGHNRGETTDLYYRAMLIDMNGNFLKIRRNHSYKLIIDGKLSYGQPSFEEALTAPATNNAWATVDEWIREINDGTNKLSVDKTHIVLDESYANNSYAFTYKLTDVDGDALSAPAEVTWQGENSIALNSFGHTYNTENGIGTVTLQLRSMGDEQMLSGKLLIKKGLLMRTVQIEMIKTQKFTPAWVSTQIYHNNTGEKVTLKFTIPETTPESLFPFSVLLSVEGMDVRFESGMTLPVITKDDPAYFGGDSLDLGYKYEYVVNAPGVQRLYLETTQKHTNGQIGELFLEGRFFETLKKTYEFNEHQKAITVSGLNMLGQDDIKTTPDYSTFAHDDDVFYHMVAQKINAPVMFDMVMINKANQSAVTVGANDEFLLYSKSLDYYEDTEFTAAKAIALFQESLNSLTEFPCEFTEVDESYWQTSTNGRVMAFRPNDRTNLKSKYKIYMKTNRSVSQDVVRISSNVSGQKSAFDSNVDYVGDSYRSVIFELANYRPFHFAAQVNGAGTVVSGVNEEVEEKITWDYADKGQEVAISFEVTSFYGSDKKSVDPFGTAFEIYIDAPMLEIDNTKNLGLNSDKFYADPTTKGRFVYVVDANRENERNGGAVLIADNAPTGITGYVPGNQTNERKTLYFKTNSICNAGEIKISSNKEKVVFYDKVFNVSNNLMTGTLKYCTPSGSQITAADIAAATNVPENAFVSFALESDGTRIGRLTVGANGAYTLNLRKEYEFSWTDPLELNYIKDDVSYDAFEIYSVDNNGNVVETPLTLSALSQPNVVIILTKSGADYLD